MAQDKDLKTPNVPTLRFPGFTDEWESQPLSHFFDFKNGLNPDAKRFGKGIKFISVSDILNNDFIDYDKVIASVDSTDKDLQEFGVNYGDILFQRSSETLEDVGRANVYLDKKTALFGGFVIRGKRKSDYDPYYMRYALSAPVNRKKIIVKGAGAQHFNIGQDGLAKVIISVPSGKEQSKIGELLSLLDRRIAAQNKIIEHLQSLIKGLIQNLVKKGLADGSWHKIRLSELLTENIELNQEYFPVYSVSVSAGVINQMEYLGRSFAAKDTAHYHVVRYGDIVYTKSPTGNQPYGIVKQSHCQTPAAVSPLYGVYRPSSFEIGSYLHYYFLNPVNTNNYLSPLIQKGAKNTINISNQHFLENSVPLPKLASRLEVISNALSTIRESIQLEINVRDELTSQRKYLLKNLFI